MPKVKRDSAAVTFVDSEHSAIAKLRDRPASTPVMSREQVAKALHEAAWQHFAPNPPGEWTEDFFRDLADAAISSLRGVTLEEVLKVVDGEIHRAKGFWDSDSDIVKWCKSIRSAIQKLGVSRG